MLGPLFGALGNQATTFGLLAHLSLFISFSFAKVYLVKIHLLRGRRRVLSFLPVSFWEL